MVCREAQCDRQHFATLIFFIFWSSVASLSSTSFLFTAVPPSTNPSSKLNLACLQEISDKLHVVSPELMDGRIWFSACSGQKNSCTPPLHTWGNLIRSGVRSIRIVILDTSFTSGRDTDIRKVEALVDSLIEKIRITRAIRLYELFGNKVNDTPFVHVACRIYADFTFKSTVSTSAVTRELALRLGLKYENWSMTQKARDAQLRLHLLLHQGNRATLELVALVPSNVVGELPHPGFKRVESWAVAKSADIQPGDVVLDPMCGRASFLVEAATFWPKASYVGIDQSEKQLVKARQNIESAKVHVELHQGDSTSELLQFKDESVDKIISCPPFGRQYKMSTNASDFYNNMIRAWSRLLITRGGKMVLVIDLGNLEALTRALNKNGCKVDSLRDFRLGKLTATLVIATKGGDVGQTPEHILHEKSGLLEWEKELLLSTDDDFDYRKLRGRILWSQARTNCLPSLVPVNPSFGRA